MKDDTISRQKAIDEAYEIIIDGQKFEVVQVETLMGLPPAQPEIIRCHECKHMQEDKIFHQCWCNGREVKPNHFCGYAERRQDAGIEHI